MIKYITLWDIMKSFNPQSLMYICHMSGLFHGTAASNPKKANQPLPAGVRDSLAIFCLDVKRECEALGLPLSGIQVGRLLDAFADPECTVKNLKELSEELAKRLGDETESRIFISLEQDKQSLLQDKNLFGEEVTAAFPSTIVDIEEAGKCLAFERATACVLHLMRVMELGLRILGDTLKLPISTNRTWEAILGKCDSELVKPFDKRSPEWQSDGQFFSEAAAMLRTVKDAWRNPTMHIDKVYTVEQAEDIWNAVRGFMRSLATKLKE